MSVNPKHELAAFRPHPLVWRIVVVAYWMASSFFGSHAFAQKSLFREPRLPNASTLGDSSIDSRPRGRFGLSPHLTSSQSIFIGVQQQGSSKFALPQGRKDLPEEPNSSELSSFADMESIEGIESDFGIQSDDDRNADVSVDVQQVVGTREIIVQRYPDGKPKIEREVAQDAAGNFFNDGFWRVKSRSGKIIAEGQYRHGVMHGPWLRHHTTESSGLFSTKPFNLFQSPFLSSVSFQQGQLDGIWTLSDAYQRKIFEIPYRSGKRHGTATWWYPTLNKMREVTFKDGLIHGKLLEWDEDTKLTREQEFDAGKKVIRNVTFFRPKQKKSESYYLDAKLEADGEDNWWAAEPAPLVSLGERVQHGPLLAWYDNGLPKMKGRYVEGNRVGRFTWWHSNGNKQLEGDYEDGKKTGRWTWWHENGMKSIEGYYDADESVGLWRWWESNGKLESQEDLTAQKVFSALDGETDNRFNLELESPGSTGNFDNPETLPEGESVPAGIYDPDPANRTPSLFGPNELEGIVPLESESKKTSNQVPEFLPEDFFTED